MVNPKVYPCRIIGDSMEKKSEVNGLHHDKPTATPPETPTDESPTWLYPSLQCKFCTDGGKGLIDCLRDYDTKDITYKMTLDRCSECWNRIESRHEEASYYQESKEGGE